MPTNKEFITAPAFSVFDVTPNDSTDLPIQTRSIYVGVGGDIKLTAISGGTVTFLNVPTGAVLPVQASRIFATGTTATNLIGVQ
jgi:hypothetical protein